MLAAVTAFAAAAFVVAGQGSGRSLDAAAQSAARTVYLPLILRRAAPAHPKPWPTVPPTDTPSPTPWPLPTAAPLAPGLPELLSPIFQAQGDSYAVTVIGRVAYLGVGPTLLLVDVGDATRPRPLGRYLLRGLVEEIVVRDAWAYVVAGDGGLWVFDVTKPAMPRYAARLPALRSSLAIAFNGDTAYLAEGVAGVRVLDVSDPAEPRELRALDTDGVVLDCDVSGRRLYLADGSGGLRIYDLADPATPKKIGAYPAPTGTQSESVVVYRNIAYVSQRVIGLQVVDVGDPTAPKLIASIDGISCCVGSDLALRGQRLYHMFSGQVTAWDLANPRSPRQVLRAVTNDYAAEALDVVGMHAFVSGGQGLRIYDLSQATPVTPLGQLAIERGDESLAVGGNLVYAGRAVVDVSNPAAPRRLPNSEPTLGQVLAVEQDWLVSRRETNREEQAAIVVSDIIDPSHPHPIATLAVPGPALSLALAGAVGVMSAFGDECSLIQVVDFSNQASPILRGQWRPEYSASAVALSGRYAYIATDGGGCDTVGPDIGTLTVLDLSDLDRPEPLATLEFDEMIAGLAVGEPLVYAAIWDEGLAIVNVADPRAPVVVGQLDIPGLAYDVAVDGDRAYVATYDPTEARPGSTLWPWHDRWGGVAVVDIGDPTSPRLIGHLATGAPGHLAIHAGTLWLASAATGIWAWR